MMRDYDIDIEEWSRVLAYDKKLLQMPEPTKRSFRYKIEITIPDAPDECKEFFETGLKLLKNIC